jgi:hypothetical protein
MKREEQAAYDDLIASLNMDDYFLKVDYMREKDNIVIRKSERRDVPLLLEFIKGIARYEKMENDVVASPEVLEREMFDEHRAEAVFAVVDGREVGFALYFYNFSTFIGHSGLYLEDLFVSEFWNDMTNLQKAKIIR